MLSEEKIKKTIIENVYQHYDRFDYGMKINGTGIVLYQVGKKLMTVSEYIEYCIKKELKRFGLK